MVFYVTNRGKDNLIKFYFFFLIIFEHSDAVFFYLLITDHETRSIRKTYN